MNIYLMFQNMLKMKKITLALFILSSCFLYAQEDTTIVQTLTLESETRNGVFEFPNDPSKTYRKVLMEYKMRCKDGVVNPGDNSTGCHEWDYSCNTFITDSTTVDSSMATHPSYIISNYGEETFPYTSVPQYDYYQKIQKEVIYNSTISERFLTIGEGDLNLEHPFSSSAKSTRAQYLWKASELSGSVLSAGNISSMRFYVEELNDKLDFLNIRLKQTTLESLDLNTIESEDFVEVYNLNSILRDGANNFKFHTPFEWDGTSNILVELSFTNESANLNTFVEGNQEDFDCSLISNTPDQYAQFNGAEFAELPNTALSNISNEITVMFWSFGNVETLPTNTSIIEATDQQNNRQANIHLPWSNGQIYWDCGNDGNGYDRINKQANEQDFKGKWNHWAFTKNAKTGNMSIYLNGSLFHSGTGNNKAIDIDRFVLGASSQKSNYYYGGINEFSIWDKALDIDVINAYLYKDIDDQHPNYDRLMAYYQANTLENNQLIDHSIYQEKATVEGALQIKNIKGNELYRNFVQDQQRPKIDFVQGEYDLTINEIIVTEAVLKPQHAVRSFSVEGTDLIEGPSIFVWLAGEELTYDENNVIVDSSSTAPENTITIDQLSYFRKFPSKYELLSFVTPYGFTLDLGPEGKTWTFDVTDFLPILKGNRRLSMERGGQFNEEFDIRFLFIEGTPAREVLSIQNIWPFASGGYDAITEERVFEERNVMMHPDGAAYKIRSSITGHGQNGEFIPRLHFLNINQGQEEFLWEVWKSCGANPVYPQGGTWIFDRAGWCPGMPSDLYENDITSFVNPGETASINYGVIPTADQSATNYLVSNQLVTYGPINFTHDAEITTIIRPSLDVRFTRENPACIDPVIEIKNLGSENLESLVIEYMIKGGIPLTYEWTGSLAFNESTQVTLPTVNLFFWQTAPSEIFEVTLSQPNGQVDLNQTNNKMTSSFKRSDKWPIAEMTFSYKTNNRASQNRLTVKDQSGSIVFERGNMENNKLYNDDITLKPGCYTMDFEDSGNDGLDFWYWAAVGQDVGTGYFQIQINGIPFKTFEPDFGSSIHYNFFVDGVVSDDQVLKNTLMTVYPNPSNGAATLELVGYEGKKIDLNITDINGNSILTKAISINTETFKQDLSMTQYSAGIYFVKITHNGNTRTRKIVKF